MSGILDNKSRVIDAMLTFEGRRQMAEGNFTIKFATFSDAAVSYNVDNSTGHADPTTRIYLEAWNAPYDQITFEADDSGNIVPFRQHNSVDGTLTPSGSLENISRWVTFKDGKLKSNTKIYTTQYNVTSSFTQEAVQGADFASQLQGLLTSSIDNFNKLRILGTSDPLFQDADFAIGPNEVQVRIPDNSMYRSMTFPTNVNTVDSLFNDEKLRNVVNFKYLPPIKKASYTIDKTDVVALKDAGLFLGDYPPWGPVDPLTLSDIKKELTTYEETAKEFFFDPTSRDNDVVGQFFEISNDQAKKLDVIDYGKIDDVSGSPNAKSNHVFFVGKVVVDDNGTECFIHLFTILFGSSEVTP